MPVKATQPVRSCSSHLILAACRFEEPDDPLRCPVRAIFGEGVTGQGDLIVCDLCEHLLDVTQRLFLRTYGNPDGMRGGFQHYGAMLEDGKANRAAFKQNLPCREGPGR